MIPEEARGEHSVQLAHDYTKHLKFLESYVKSDTFALSEKLDGVRVTALALPQGTRDFILAKVKD